MSQHCNHNSSSNNFIGAVLIALGAVYLAHNFGYIEMEPLWSLWRYWPVLIILIGANKFITANNWHRRGSGIWTMFIGSWLYVSMFHVWGLTFRTSWPILLIGVGISIVWKSFYRDSQLKY